VSLFAYDFKEARANSGTCVGLGNTNYATLLVDLWIQLHHELPESLRTAYEEMLFMNWNGKEDGYSGCDYGLELIVGEAKVSSLFFGLLRVK
jgi:hypothetical protein